MLPKNRRIPRELIQSGFFAAQKYTSPHFFLSVKPFSGDSRFSFSISKKIEKTAVARNTYRRRGYSTIASLLPRLHTGFLCLFSYKKGSYPVSFATIEKEIVQLLGQSGVLLL